MKKMANMVTLLMLVSVNFMTPISYAQDADFSVNIEQTNLQEVEEESLPEATEGSVDKKELAEITPEVVAEGDNKQTVETAQEPQIEEDNGGQKNESEDLQAQNKNAEQSNQNDDINGQENSDEGLIEIAGDEEDETQDSNGTIVYEDGLIKLSDGDRTIYVKDKNVGAEGDYVRLRELHHIFNNVCVTLSAPESIQTTNGLSIQATEYGFDEETLNCETLYETIQEETESLYGNYYWWGNTTGFAKYPEFYQEDFDWEGGNVAKSVSAGEIYVKESALSRGFSNGANLNNEGWMQGGLDNPCSGENEYLPTPEDWANLMTLWGDITNNEYDDGGAIPMSLNTSSLNREGSIEFDDYILRQFHDALLIPYAGYTTPYTPFLELSNDEPYMLKYNNGMKLRTSIDANGYYGEFKDYGLFYTNQNTEDIGRYSMPVRCFVYVNPVKITYNLGDNETYEKAVEKGSTIENPYLPEKEGYLFMGWYEDPTYEGQSFDFSIPIEDNIQLYAKWAQIIYEDEDIIYVDTNGKVFSGIGTITFTDGVNTVKMLDRNLGADVSLKDEIQEGDNKYGYYFQWGNNYGFLPEDTQTDTEPVDVSQYGWNNPYVSNTFIVDNASWIDTSTGTDEADNLWGGLGDYRDNTRDSNEEGHDYMRQGPCPEGYHVPSGGERLELISLWSDYHHESDDALAISTSSHASYLDFIDAFLLPKAGKIEYEGYSSLGESSILSVNSLDVSNRKKNIYLWTSSPYYRFNGSLYGSRRLFIAKDAKAQSSVERAYGLPIRCFADNYEDEEPLVLSYDTRGGSAIQAQTIPEGEKGYLPGYTTSRNDAELLGWYSDKGELELSGNIINNLTMASNDANDGVVTIYARWSDDHVVTFKDHDGRVIKVVLVKEGENVETPANPTRNGYKFTGWDVDLTNVTSDLVVTAQYSAESSGYSGGGSRGGGSKPEPSHNSADDEDKNVETKSLPNNDTTKQEVEPKDNSTDTQPQDGGSKNGGTTVGEKAEQYTKETTEAYTWAFTEGLTKYNNISDARMGDFLNRSEMAKITTIFATKFRGETPDENKKEFCSKYSDLWKVEEDTKEYIIQSCELGYMGYQANGVDALERFRPYTPVSVAEVSIILSRLMWGNRYAVSENKWYQGHLWAVYEHRLIDNISKPFNDITRKDAFTMLYRLSSSDILRD